MQLRKTLYALVAFVVIMTAPVVARPNCSDVNKFEDWQGNKETAGRNALDNNQYAAAFRILKDVGDASIDCMQAMIDYHTKLGMDAGNTDEDGLRQISVESFYTAAAEDYDKAAQAAAALHHVSDCHEMVANASKAYQYTKIANLSRDLADEDHACVRR